MSSIRHQRRVLAIAQIGPVIEQSVGGPGGENRVNRRVGGRYGELDGDGGAAGNFTEGLREKTFIRGGEIVQHPLVFIVAAVQLPSWSEMVMEKARGWAEVSSEGLLE